MPDRWHVIYQRLKQAAATDASIPPPPTPLILAGWAYSNDIEKRERWRDTVAWASKHGLTAAIGDLEPESMYVVVGELSDYPVGPLGGPMYLDWNFDPKSKIQPSVRIETIEFLKSKWVEVVGSDLGSITSPLRLTGAKGRRLVVAVTCEKASPWGGWTALARDERRRAFTAFRAAINKAIDPLEVDHIDFVLSADLEIDLPLL